MEQPKNMNEFLTGLRLGFGTKCAIRFLRDGNVCDKSYLELDLDSYYISTFLLKKHGSKNKISIISNSSYELFTAYFAITRSGNIVSMMNPALPKEKLLENMKFIDTRILFLSNDFISMKQYFQDNSDILIYSLEDDWDEMAEYDYKLAADISEDDIAQLSFTSGTTGDSKVVICTNRNILSAIFQETESYSCHFVIFSLLPAYHCFEFISIDLFTLSFGGTVFINDKIENLFKNIRIANPHFIPLVPVLSEKMAALIRPVYDKLMNDEVLKMSRREKRQHFKSVYETILSPNVHTLYIGGAYVEPYLIEFFTNLGINVKVGYGATETMGKILMQFHDNLYMNSVGQPKNKQIKWKLVNKELYLKADCITPGYYKNEEATKKSFTEDGYYKTGDMFDLADDDYFIFIGRSNNLIVLNNGENVYPEELENELNKNKAINECIVFEYEKQISCLIKCNSDKQEEIKKYIRQMNSGNPVFKNITNIFFTDRPLPKNSMGKIKRGLDKLEPYLTKKDITDSDISEEQLKLSNLIYSYLHKRIGINDNFFLNGLDSLTTIAIASKLNIDPQDIYNNPSICELSEFLCSKDIYRQITDESDINNLIVSTGCRQLDRKNDDYLIIGANGFLGIHILHELLRQNKTVYCLVRSRQKLLDNYRFYFNSELPDSVGIFPGDITEKLLFSKKEDYDYLCRRVSHVIHTAAIVTHLGSNEAAIKVNFEGTKNVAEFAKAADAVLHYISSYSVSGIGLTEQMKINSSFNEFMLYNNQKYYQNVYVNSKYLSEKFLIEERQRGLYSNIYRLGSLTWDKDGKFQINEEENGLIHRIRGFKAVKKYPDFCEKFGFDLTMIDDCCDAFIKLLQRNSYNEIYHLVNPYSISFADLSSYFGDCRRAEMDEIIGEFSSDTDKSVSIYIMYLNMMQKSYPNNFDCSYTLKILSENGFSWTKPDIGYLKLKF